MTADRPWKPYTDEFAERERRVSSVASKVYYENILMQHNTDRQIAAAIAVRDATMTTSPYDEDDMATLLIAKVIVAADDHDGDGISGRENEVVYPPNEEHRRIKALSTTEKRSALTPEILSRRWNIGLDTAKKTLHATTQAGVRNVLAPGERKVRQRLDHLKFPNLRGQ